MKPQGTEVTGIDRPAVPYAAATPGDRSSGTGWGESVARRLRREVPLPVGFAILVIAGIGLASMVDAIERNKCISRWHDSTVAARYNWRHGCMVNTPGYGWVPEKNFNAGRP